MARVTEESLRKQLIEMKTKAFYCPRKDYNSAQDAGLKMESQKQKIMDGLRRSRDLQLEHFKSQIREMVEKGTQVLNMPTIRVVKRDSLSRTLQDISSGFTSQKASVTRNLGQTMYGSRYRQGSVERTFEASDAHHRFRKEDAHLRRLYRRICQSNH